MTVHDQSLINNADPLTLAQPTASLTLAGRIARQRMERSAFRKRTRQYAPKGAPPGSLIKAALEYDGLVPGTHDFQHALQRQTLWQKYDVGTP